MKKEKFSMSGKELMEKWDTKLGYFENLKKLGVPCLHCNGEIAQSVDKGGHMKIYCKDCGKVLAQCL